jgi:hypothetical protein
MPSDQVQHSDRPNVTGADFRIDYHGLMTTITPLTDACREWLKNNINADEQFWVGDAVATHRSTLDDVVHELVDGGFTPDS